MPETPPTEFSASPIRRAVCLMFAGLLAGWALWFATTSYINVLHDAANAHPSITELIVQRLEPARAVLEGTRSVRYVQREENYDSNTVKARRAIAEYVLVPVLVTDDPSENLILADFADDPTLAEYMQSHPVTLIEHLGPGLGILEVNH